MEKKWKRIDKGLYQRIDDGIPQNVYIDRVGRMSESGKSLIVDGWMGCEKVNGTYEAMGEWWHTLREAKAEMMNVKGVDDGI